MGHIRTRMGEYNTSTINGYNNPQAPLKRELRASPDTLIMTCIESRPPASGKVCGVNQ